MNWIGLDIGGANIKVASTDGEVSSLPFRFWVEHELLKVVLEEILSSYSHPQVAATMTAELADCFESRAAGVRFIVDALADVCVELGIAAPVFAGTDLVFRNAEAAKQHWLKTAASNWGLMASFASRCLPNHTGVVIDMGSTTTDIIPVRNGEVKAKGKTDSERLRFGELVYVGADRTSVSSLVDSLMYGDVEIPVANELFATVGDAMLLCGLRDEEPDRVDTADGRPRTRKHAAQRLCRMVCEDLDTIGMEAAKSFAVQVLQTVESRVREPLLRLEDKTKFKDVIVTGSGVAFLESILKSSFSHLSVARLGSHLDERVDSVAPAWAVAVLSRESRQQ